MEKVIQPAPYVASQFPSIGRWQITHLPSGWIYVSGFGIRQITADPKGVSATVCLVQDVLETDDGLAAYIERQKQMIAGHLKGITLAGPIPTALRGAEEAQLLMARHLVEKVGPFIHAQTYARVGKWLGIVTVTAPESELRAVRPVCDEFVRGLYIQPEPAEVQQVQQPGSPAFDAAKRPL